MVDEIVESAEEKAIRMKKEYTDRLRDEYIAVETEKNPDFIFNEDLWADRPRWSDEIEQRPPKSIKPQHMQSVFPPGSVVPYVVVAAIVAIVLLIVLF
jgi:hypothetical protein